MMKLFPAHQKGVENGNIHIFPRKVEKFFQCLQLYVMRFSLLPNLVMNELVWRGDENKWLGMIEVKH